MHDMVALVARLEAKPGKEQEVAELLESGLPVLEDGPRPTAWFAVRFGLLEFGLFNAFPEQLGSESHFVEKVAAALKDNDYLFEETPLLKTADVLAAKLPG